VTMTYTPAEIGALASGFDPLRPPATDEEPWLPGDPELDHRGPRSSTARSSRPAGGSTSPRPVVAALAVVLVAIGLRRAVR
jgi:hypothetical protein